LIEEYDNDAETQQLLDTYDFFLLPVVNPDGYVHSWDAV